MDILNLDELQSLNTTCLIEASAGTGKTFSISHIFLQAILSEMPIEKILVVTYTDAATKELKSKIREKLSQALQVVNETLDDETISNIFALFADKEIKTLLETAMLNIDQAAIFTMHSFCQRMLTENAFESKIAYGAELITDYKDIIRELVENFWRKNIVSIPEEESELYKNIKFDDILKLAENLVKFHNVEIVNNDIHALNKSVEQINKYKTKLKDDSLKKELASLFEPNEHYGKNYKEFFSYVDKLRIIFEEDTFSEGKSKTVIKNCGTAWIQEKSLSAKGKKSGTIPPSHELFDFCDELKTFKSICKAKELEIYNSLNDYLKKEFEEIKEKQNILTFDDLLIKLHKALLDNTQDDALSQLIKKKFSLALVDEFQDTDVIQYEIFNHLFGDKKDREHGFFMIGDPKQSIYKFRNADIFSYLKAKTSADSKFTLNTNYRSEPNMVSAINAFFKVKDDGKETFAFCANKGNEGIEFVGVNSSPQKADLKIENDEDSYLNCWLVDGFNANEIERNIAEHIASKIISLMHKSQNGEAYYEGEKEVIPLSMGDFAILVDTHKQAGMLKHVLSKYSIPAVIQNSAKIFESWEARELELWIKAVKEPIKKNLTALFITSFMSKTANEIYNIEDSEIFELAEYFMDLQKSWHRNGIFMTFLDFVKSNQVKEKVLQLNNGERIISNYMHLLELLHKNEIEEGLGLDRTLVFLTNNIASSDEGDEYIQRLESDSKSVKIMTIHKSKGLEFSVVFCPFIWNKAISKKGFEKNQKIFLFNEEVGGKYKQKLDFGADKNITEENLKFARRETLAENIRLLYVALTRAKNRCYLGIGNDTKTVESILLYLFSDKKVEDIIEETASNEKEGYLSEIISTLKEYCAENNISFTEKVKLNNLENYKELDNDVKLEVMKFTGEIKRNWGIGSFSSLTKYHKSTHIKTEIGEGIFALPKGSIFGLAIHKIFENYFNFGVLDFEKNNAKYFQQPLKQLNYFRSKNEEERNDRFDMVRKMFNNVLSAQIATANCAICLKNIEPNDAKVELDFFYKINKISPLLLQKIFAKYANINIKDFSVKLGKLNFNLKNGFMNGQIDLVFRSDERYFILDWKTNHLGPNCDFYSQSKMLDNMQESYYVLQYHIYCLALHLYLKTQLKDYIYEKHFGGAIYIYTRGINNQGNGIYCDIPKQELLEALEKELILNS